MKLPEQPGYRIFGGDYRGACPTEDLEQITFFNEIRRRFPATHGLLAIHPRNEGLKTAGQFAAVQRHRAEGMTAGAADIVIPGAPAFVCELKRRDPRKSQWQDGQEAYLTAAANMGAFACLAFGWEAAWEAFEAWRAV